MWKLWHYLFGWHYVAFLYGSYWHLERVYKTPNGSFYVKVHNSIFKLLPDGQCSENTYNKWEALTPIEVKN